MLLSVLKSWSPFHIDALGIVTILGAPEVDRAVGRLAQSRFTDWLPLLGAYTIANNQVTEPLPGFVLFNITDGIVARDVSGWFSRWLLCQRLTFNSSTITISKRVGARHSWQISALILGILAFTAIIVSGALMGDWWGLANGISMALSVIVRRIVVTANERGLDYGADKKFTSDATVKVFLTMPTGKAVTILAPRSVVINCLLTNPVLQRPQLYAATRALGWAAFGTHVISLGMALLFSQILSVFVMLTATILTTYHVGNDERRIGSRLFLHQSDVPGRDVRAAAYARLGLSEKEEESMLMWNLFPHRSNVHWWNTYRQCLSNAKTSQAFAKWDEFLAKAP